MAKTRTLIIVLAAAFLLVGCRGDEPSKKDRTQVVKAMHKSAKRGVSFNFAQLTDLPLLSPYISWDYNWGNTPTADAGMWFDANEMDYCPMCWNGNYNSDAIRAYVAAHPKTKYLLAFNEPNLKDQANMTPKEAAQLWPEVVALARELNLRLVSPAMNYGTLAGYSDPIKWLDDFFAEQGVSIDDIDAIAIHCYMSSPSAVKGYVERFAKYGKPIWMTEFCAWDPAPGSYNTQMDYMCSVLHYMEQSQMVERYAWFMPRMSGKVESVPYNQLLTHDYPAALTDLGKLFCYFSPCDTTVWIEATRDIWANEYCRVSNEAMQLRPSNDELMKEKMGAEGLMITNFAEGDKIDYQLYIAEDASRLELRYSSYSDAICEILVDGKSQNYLSMPRNGSSTEWTSASIAQNIESGKHTISLSLISGSCQLSAIRIE